MDRLDSIKQIFEEVEENDIVITSPGLISREVYWYKDRPLNFYCMGAMGCSLALGIGIALHTDYDVYVIHGDGDTLMGLGSIATLEQLNIPNLYNVVFINNMHETTGGQKIIRSPFTERIWGLYTEAFFLNPDPTVPPRIPLKPIEITRRFRDAFKSVRNEVE